MQMKRFAISDLKTILWMCLVFFLGEPAIHPAGAIDRGPAETYYIRLDMTSSNHRIVGQRLTMVPVYNDFMAEDFSVQTVSQLIMTDRQTSNHTLENLAKKQAFMQILEQKGLKSVSTMDQTTVISYEGMVYTPIDLQIAPHDETLEGYPFTAQIRFAPVAFPDQWESMKQRFQIKALLNDFFLLFR